jgi:PAS domain S-box-containing protein
VSVSELSADPALQPTKHGERFQRAHVHDPIAKVLTDHSPVAMYHLISPGLPMQVNPAFRRMFGVGAELSIEAWVETIHPDDRQRTKVEWEAYAARHANSSAEFCCRYRTRDHSGIIRFVLETVVQLTDSQGFVGTVTDVTELVHAQLDLERTHKALQMASRQAGMAEVATSVLHNVGNVLNSVNVSAQLLETRLRNPRLTGFARIAELLQSQSKDLAAFLTLDERGQHLPSYLTQLSSQLLSDQKDALTELASLVQSVEHLKQVVGMQQTYAMRCELTETLEIADLINDAVRMNASAFNRHGVSLTLEMDTVPPITVDKHRVLQILVNLLRNAKYACDESPRTGKAVTVRAQACDGGVRIAVIDNGVGIAPEHMPRLFQHGFTTRPDGHGFGLHSAALAAKELHGTLQAFSAGLDQGATFALELPLQPPKRPA